MCFRKTFVRHQAELINYEAIIIKYFVCVCILSLYIQHANCVFSPSYYTVTCGLSGSTKLFPHYFINGTILGKKLLKKRLLECSLQEVPLATRIFGVNATFSLVFVAHHVY
jgi:hypothetical protein